MLNDPRYLFIIEGMIILLVLNIINLVKELIQRSKNIKESLKHYYFEKYIYNKHTRRRLFINCMSIYIIILCIVLPLFLFDDSSSTEDDNNISEKINAISNNLEETAIELTNIQQLLEARIEYVEDLKKEAEIAENVISLSEEQVNAVQAKINQELTANSGRDIIISIVISAFFFTLGLILPQIIQAIRNKKTTNKQILPAQKYSQEELFVLLNEVKDAIDKNITKSSSNEK